MDPEDDDGDEFEVDYDVLESLGVKMIIDDERSLFIVGTAHVSEKSQEDVATGSLFLKTFYMCFFICACNIFFSQKSC